MSQCLSMYSKRKGMGRTPFTPEPERWKNLCRHSAYDNQIFRSLGISSSTFYAFLDREHLKEEQDPTYSSQFLLDYKNERQKTRDIINTAFMDKVMSGDTASILYGMKTYGGMLEAKDVANIEIKKREVTLKTKDFLSHLAEKFNLSFEQLREFAKKYFKDIELEV